MVLWFNPSLPELVRRLQKATDARPILANIQSSTELKEKLSQLIEKRQPWYAQAHLIIPDDFPNLEEMLHQIAQFL